MFIRTGYNGGVLHGEYNLDNKTPFPSFLPI
jgi:hypothetical protein